MVIRRQEGDLSVIFAPGKTDAAATEDLMGTGDCLHSPVFTVEMPGDDERRALLVFESLCGQMEGAEAVLEALLGVVYRKGREDVRTEMRGAPEFKSPYVVFQCSHDDRRYLRIDVDGQEDGGMGDPVDFRIHLIHLLESQGHEVGCHVPYVGIVPRPQPDFMYRSGILIPVPKQK